MSPRGAAPYARIELFAIAAFAGQWVALRTRQRPCAIDGRALLDGAVECLSAADRLAAAGGSLAAAPAAVAGIAVVAGIAGIAGPLGRLALRAASGRPFSARRRREITGLAIAALLVFAGSFKLARSAIAPPAGEDHVAGLLAGEVRSAASRRMAGTVASVRPNRGGGARVVVEIDGQRLDTPTVLQGRVALYVRHGGDRLSVGERIAFTSTLRRIEGFGNFGEPDWEAVNARQGLFVSAFVWSEQDIDRLPSTAAGGGGGLMPATPAAPATPAGRLTRLLGDDPAAALVIALVTGDRAQLDPATVDSMRAAGLAHVLAISGLHVGIVAGFVVWAVRALALRSALARAGCDVVRPAAAAALAALVAYATMGAGGVSVARASVSGALSLRALFIGTAARPFRALAWAALAVLAAAPAAVMEPGFQLSFSAAAAILALAHRNARKHAGAAARDDRVGAAFGTAAGTAAGPATAAGSRRAPLRAWLGAALAVSAVAWAATLPLIAHHFQRVSWVAPLVNPLAALPVAATVILGLIAAVMHALTGLGGWLFEPAVLAAKLVLVIAGAGAALPFAESAVIAPGAAAALLLSCAVTVALLSESRLPVAAMAGLALVGALSAVHERYRVDRLDAVFLSVGQGDSTILRLPGGRIAVVDAGPAGRGRRVVEPALRRMHVSRIDYLVVTHVQSDHFGGALHLVERMEVGELWHPGGVCSSAGFAELLDAAASRGVRVVDLESVGGCGRGCDRDGAAGVADATGTGSVAGRGWRIDRLETHRPGRPGEPSRRPGSGACDDNDRSIVLRVGFAGQSILLPGDIERAAEQALVGGDRDLRAQILKSPHHGSATSSTAGFLDAVAPSLAVVSAGRANRYGFPAEAVVARLAARGVAMLRTDLDGAIRVTVDADGFRVRTAKRR